MPQNPLTLTRQSLYDLVWSRPMVEVAKDFNISDVALAKRCKAVDVPVPPRGYWARIAAGQTPPKTPLPKYRTRTATTAESTPTPKGTPKAVVRTGPEPIVSFSIPERTTTPSDTPTPTADEAQQLLSDRIAALAIAPTNTLGETCAAVRRTAKHHKHPDRAMLPFATSERVGSLVDIDVTPVTLDRALHLADRLIRTAEALGWPIEIPAPSKDPEQPPRSRFQNAEPAPKPAPPLARILVDDEPIAFRIEERYRTDPRTPTATELAREKRDSWYHAPRTMDVATGALRVVRVKPSYWTPQRRTWYDHRGHLVEDKIPRILASFYDLAQEIKEERADDERRHRIREEERRLAEEAKARREAHAKLRAELERQAGAWARARLLRRYIHAARRTVGDRTIQVPFLDKSIDFLDWATNYVDQLDPLSATPRNPDQWPEPRSYVYSDEDALKRMLLRVTGFDGHQAPKLADFGINQESAADGAKKGSDGN